MTDVMQDDYARNLALLCETERSVAALCRTLGINRQQFARYLSGRNRPSRNNERKIRQYFGLQEQSLYLPHEQFRTLYDTVDVSRVESGDPVLSGFSDSISVNLRQMRPYLGFYHRYIHAFGWENYILRGLVHLYEEKGRVLCKTIERLRDPVTGNRYVLKYAGVVTMKADRLHIVETDMLHNEELTLTILYRTFRSHPTLLSGLTMGSSSRARRDPAATRAVFSYLGKTVDYRVAIRSCGIFPPNSLEISPQIKPLLENRIHKGYKVLTAEMIE